MEALQSHFVSPVLRLDTGMRYHYLPLPDGVGEAFWDAGVRRVIATLNGTPIRRALQRTAAGQVHLVVGQALLHGAGAALGDMVDVTLRPDPEPDRIDLGEEFAAALELDAEAAARFYSFTPGHQRSLASYVTSAKKPETRIKRALELAGKIRTHTLYGDAARDT